MKIEKYLKNIDKYLEENRIDKKDRIDEASFTRQHYNKIAKLFKQYKVDDGLINAFADMFEDDNPNFKRKFFIDACK